MSAANPFREVIRRKSHDLHDLELFAGVCFRALGRATRAVHELELHKRITSFLGNPSPYATNEQFEAAKNRASEVARFAESQQETGFPYLFGLCTVRLWGLLEATVDELVIEAMRDPERCKDQVLIGKLKGPLVEFRSASSDEQAEFLAETLKQTVDATLKPGAGRFEAVLEPVGLGGAIDDTIRRPLFELSQIRNVVVHKGGKADRRLVESCASLNLQRAAAVHVTGAMFSRYVEAAYWYLLELSGRISERDGKPRDPELSELQVHVLRSSPPIPQPPSAGTTEGDA